MTHTPGPVVTVLTEAGRGVGLGHLRRCQALAGALAAAGADVEVAVTGQGWEPATAGQVDWLDDAAALRTLLLARRCEAVVVDSYRADEPLLRGLRAQVPCVVAIDDLADRALPVSIVVNGTWYAFRLTYRTDPDTRRLLGPQYALLDRAYASPVTGSPTAEVRRVLVTLGGDADTAALLPSTVAIVRRAAPAAVVDVVTMVAVPELDGASGVTVHRGVTSLRGLIAAADLVVSGGGMTLYECLASATPVVATVLVDNQRLNVGEMARAGLVVGPEPSLEAALTRVVGDVALRRTLATRGREAVDGRGALRVAAEIVRACRAVDPAGGRR